MRITLVFLLCVAGPGVVLSDARMAEMEVQMEPFVTEGKRVPEGPGAAMPGPMWLPPPPIQLPKVGLRRAGQWRGTVRPQQYRYVREVRLRFALLPNLSTPPATSPRLRYHKT